MTFFPLRPGPAVHATEYMDEPDADPRELEESHAHVAAVNRWLGGWRALRRHLAAVLPAPGGRPAVVLDAGTGSADLARALVDWARRTGRRVQVVAAELHPGTLAIAARHSISYPEIEIVRADARGLPCPDRAFDAALLTLTLHHLEGEERVRVLRELARVARVIIVSELERCWPNYLGAWLLARTLWRRNRLSRHDAPLSVRRAFTRAELLALAQRAGLANPRVYRHYFHRLVLVSPSHARLRSG